MLMAHLVGSVDTSKPVWDRGTAAAADLTPVGMVAAPTQRSGACIHHYSTIRNIV